MRNNAAPALLVLALMVGAVGCGADTPNGAGPKVESVPETSDAPATVAPTATGNPLPETSAAPFTFLDVGGGIGSGNDLGLVGVRTSRHPGYDRVVFELGGTGTPGWRVEYTSDPTADASGEPVTLKGTVFLRVLLRGLGLPYDTGLQPFGDDSMQLPGTGTRAVAEIAPGGVFEGDQQAFIGLNGNKRPFRVFALANPARVVVDVIDD